ncbi:ras-related protein Rab-22A-like [Pundamilia nyererei]|uniref:Ras-related protein Rab-22A-like n=1 Tax=Pundamilia nyererei TaxID=303518 RepID=A0A9Y3R8R4_9CICH|nr:PREDICTED: ras-related protein Rab-22A-like [Pundamilia nyererei]
MALRELKVCLLGDTGVGKSSIVWRFVEDSFDPNINPTIGVPTENPRMHREYMQKGHRQSASCSLNFHSRYCVLVLVLFYSVSHLTNLCHQDSFQTLKNWVKELRQHGPPNIVVAIAGNKCDLSDAREVPEKDAKDYADSIHAIFVETSAKNAININEVFVEISKRIPVVDEAGGSSARGFKLGRQASESRRTCC